MGRRIIGQCSIVDFRYLEHLSDVMDRGEPVDMDNLNNTQKVAVRVLYHLQLCGVPFKVALKIKQVLLWEMPDKGLAFEYKLLDPKDSETRQILWLMQPKKVAINGRHR